MTPAHRSLNWTKPAALVAGVFGAMTLVAGASVLFGPQSAQGIAGDFVPVVVWVNFLAGFLYVVAALGLWQGRAWAEALAWVIVAVTAAGALVFAGQVLRGTDFEPRTVGALSLRLGVWVAIALALRRSGRVS